MSSDKKLVLKRIKEVFNSEKHVPNNLRLPRDIEFVIKGNNVEMILTKRAVLSNMQEDKASFEGWATILKRWGNFDNVSLSWDKPDSEIISSEAAHYQRFLFRVKHFTVDFAKWFFISPKCQHYINALSIDDATDYYLSPPYNERDNKNQHGKESILEYKFSHGEWNNDLKLFTDAEYINRQLPVGVFKKPVSNKTKILPKNKSAIDIWGISNDNDLLIFELKAEGNNKVGIISELYFYCCVMQRIRNGQFKYEKYQVTNLDRIAKTSRIKGYFLAPALHPLIDKALVNILNVGVNPDMGFNYLKFPKSGGVPVTLGF